MKLWIYRIFLILCTCCVLGFILYNSTRTSEQSAAISKDFTETVVQVVKPEVESMEEQKKQEVVVSLNDFLRSLAHVAEFIALAFFIALLMFTFKFRYGRYAIPSVLVLLGCFAYALCDELLQGTFQGRVPQITDVAMDTLGVAIGIVVACAMDFLVVHCRKR